MKELKKIFCSRTREIPSLETIKEELSRNDRIRIDYNSKFNFLFIRNLKRQIRNIEDLLNVEIQKGEFKDLKFYNLYNLFSENEVKKISERLEEAIKSYRLISERLIKRFEEKYNYSFTDTNKSFAKIKGQIEQDKNQLSENWSYRFHGGDICFSNSKSGQIVDINLKYNGFYGVIDLWFFQYFMQTTNEFKSISSIYIDNTPKLIQTLDYLKEKGKVKLVKSEFDFLDSEKLIWNENSK
ncbi:DUF6896 domain-containing protein [Aquimarina algicola]|uniref:DUF6896 domain-containing protein n=1 Tax=Aquimarina algicola TaxID=2589995 RepID=A0A504JEI4_9FLAO|nr:hypothetical protein [Aquimarina algicola]TPN86845.1 hypothetical protein FHK87_04380 [Aquimarina algicola]